MSKVGGALPSWYWPPGIPRRVAVPQQPLSRILRQRLSKDVEKPAYRSGRTWVTRGQLLERALAVAGGIQRLEPPGESIALLEPRPGDALPLLLAAWIAGRRVFLGNATAEAGLLAAQLREAGASVAITETGCPVAETLPDLRLHSSAELEGAEPPRATPGRATDAALLIPSPSGVVVHSHFSLSAMATSLMSFVRELRELGYLCVAPLWSWEALLGTVGGLLQGRPIVFSTLQELEEEPPSLTDGPAYTILLRADADRLSNQRRGPQALQRLKYVFVSTGPFARRWRRRVEHCLGRPILPLWGAPEVGPAVVAHPSWFPVASHGFPLVNVSLVPLEPSTGQVSVVPWEMLTRAEIGVDSLSAMVGYASTDTRAPGRVGKVVRTLQVASIDHVGVVTLHDVGAGGGSASHAA